MNQDESVHKEQVQVAQYQLGLVLGFFPRVDALLAALLGLNVAMLGVAFARAPAVFTSQQVVVAVIYLALTAISLMHLYRGSFPDTDGGIGSLVYFGEIAKLEPADYVERFGKQSEAELSRALLHQAWRNSCILNNKFQSLKVAYHWLLASVVPWAVALLVFSPGKGA